MEKIALFWFRRDLRLHDNCGLYHALKSGYMVLPIFIFDSNILDDLSNKEDLRLNFIHQELGRINNKLQEKNANLLTLYGSPREEIEKLLERYSVNAVYTNKDYEPYAIKRDKGVANMLNSKGIEFHAFKDQVIFEEKEIVKDDGSPYLVYTPYSKKWLETLGDENLKSYPSASLENWFTSNEERFHTLESIGFSHTSFKYPTKSVNKETLINYEDERNRPDKDSTSRLGIHLRFGTISIRELAKEAQKHSLTYFKELIWREFFMMILFHFPHVVDANYNAKYNGIQWRNNEEEFEKWKNGKTGFPLVDAGIRELNKTGFMHNRVRMLVASFLCKHLLIDWKWGEAYFAEKLLDYELAANNGNWQWCAGTGVDASPYFRVFNPTTQLDKFDPNKIYVKRWVEEFGSSNYPKEMVEHKLARERAINQYKEALANQ